MLGVHVDDIEGPLLPDVDVGCAVMREDDICLLPSHSHGGDVLLVEAV